MKTTIVRLTVTVILVITFSLNYSCTEKTDSEIKVNDLKTLSAGFREPAAEYTTAPFFVWNGEITRGEIDNFLDDFYKQGIKQVFIHPRPGLITEYLSEEWFELYKYTVLRGKEMGMKVWIYDENSYPSGFAGGHVPAEMPESYNQGQGLRMLRVETLLDTADQFYLVLKEENGAFTDITNSLKSETGKTGKYCLFRKTYNAPSEWYGGFPYVDLLYPGVTQKFIGITMQGYEKHLGDEFGSTIPGIFTDEPHIASPGGIRFTPDLFDVFMKRWNYDLKLHLPSLFEERGDWKRVRHNYTSTLLQMFIERWAKPWKEYCDSKGLKFTGHYWEHEWPAMRHGGDNMAMYAWHHVPAIDMLFNQFNDSSSKAQFGNVRSVKELASAANQSGWNRKLSETYGGSGWDITFAEMKRNGDWEYALGVNLMNQHLTYFTMAGARKYDYPPSFDYHEPWWNNYRLLADHYARLSLALSAGRQINDIMVIEPTTTTWMYDSYVKPAQALNKIGQAFQSFITALEKRQVEYDLGSENIIKNMGSVKKDRFVVGKCSYKTVVIPPLTENLDMATFRLLQRFARAGGKLILFSSPSLIDGSENDELKNFISDSRGNIIKAVELTDDFIAANLANRNVSFSKPEGKGLYHHTRVLADGIVVFLVNSDLGNNLSGTLTVPGTSAICLNTIEGEIKGYPSEITEGKVKASYTLPPAGSLLLFFPSGKEESYHAETISAANDSELSPSGPLTVLRNEPNAMMIDFCDLELAGKTEHDLHVYNAADKVFKHYGFTSGNPWNHSVQYRRTTVDRDTFGINTGFKATYKFTVRGLNDKSSVMAVIERPHLWKATCNGKDITPEPEQWWLDRSFRVFRIGDLVKEGSNEITLSVSPMKVHAEIEPVYIIGDFSVEPDIKGWIITPPRKELQPGWWINQGMPFYSWSVSYSTEYNISSPVGKYILNVPEWKGTIAEAYVNGRKAGIIAFPPYQHDITGFITAGINKIELRIIGSLKNLQGPHHNNPPAGISSPWSWRNVKKYPSGKEYKLYNYGLNGSFVLINRN